MLMLLAQYTLIFAAVLILVALGGCYSEHSGVINIGLEGTMIAGAFAGTLCLSLFPADMPPCAGFALIVLVSLAAGMAFSLLLALACVTFKADQVLIGTAMNMIALAGATIAAKTFNARIDPTNATPVIRYLDGNAFYTIDIGGFSLNAFVPLTVVLLVIAYVVMYRTRFGLRLRACGEHPQAADTLGIDVLKMRYAGVLISGAFAGIGGLVYVTAGVSEWNFSYGVAGFGFLALAVMVFGQWKPLPIAGAAVLFGLFRALASVYTGFDWLVALNLPSAFYNMLPYLVSLAVLAFASKNSKAPKAEGIPYEKGRR